MVVFQTFFQTHFQTFQMIIKNEILFKVQTEFSVQSTTKMFSLTTIVKDKLFMNQSEKEFSSCRVYLEDCGNSNVESQTIKFCDLMLVDYFFYTLSLRVCPYRASASAAALTLVMDHIDSSLYNPHQASVPCPFTNIDLASTLPLLLPQTLGVAML